MYYIQNKDITNISEDNQRIELNTTDIPTIVSIKIKIHPIQFDTIEKFMRQKTNRKDLYL